MRFQYSFQKIVDLKENEKMQAEWVLSGAAQRLRQEEESLQTLRSEKTDVQSMLFRSVEGSVMASELVELQLYLDHLDQRIKHKTQDVEHAEQNVAQKRNVLSSKMIEEKVWTKAREKAYMQFNADLLKKEQAELDEIAVARYKKH